MTTKKNLILTAALALAAAANAAVTVMVPMTTNGVVLVPAFAFTNNLLTTTNGALLQTGSRNLTNWSGIATNLVVQSSGGTATNLYVVGGLNMDSNQPAPTYLEGKVFYDTTQHTLAYYNDNNQMTVNVAQENVTRVRNRSGVTIPDGSTVYLAGAQGQVSTVALALGNDPVAGRVYGVSTVDMLDGDFGYVTISGLVNGLNTSAYWDGSDIYASTNVAGGFQTNSYPGATLIGKVAYAHNNQGRILVNIVQNAVLSAQQTQWPYTAITNSPWLTDNWVGRVISSEATTVTLGTGSKLELTDGTPFIFDSPLTGAFHGTFTGDLIGTALLANDAGIAARLATTGLPPVYYLAHDDDGNGTWTRDGSQWTNLQASAVTGNLTNNTSGKSSYATNAGTAAYVSGDLTNRVSFSTNATLASFVSGKLTNSISGTADEALFANSASTATSATSANSANFATSATSATYASFATNAINFAVSNELTLGITYPTIVTSGSAGLAIDQPLTVGGTTPGLTFGSGGPSITASGTALSLRTNVVVTTNVVTLAAGGANTLVVANGRVGVGKAPSAGSATLDVSGVISASGTIGGYNLSADGAGFIGFSARSYLTSTATLASFVDYTLTNPFSLRVSNLFATSAIITNNLTASNIVTSVPKWVDCASHIYWQTGAGAGSSVTNSITVGDVGDGTFGMMMLQTNGTERLPFVAEAPHTLCDTNSSITAASLYTEAHMHVRSLTNCPANQTNAYFVIIWKGYLSKWSTNSVPQTNLVSVSLGSSSLDTLVESSHLWYTNFHPSIASTFPGTWIRTNGPGAYLGPIVVKVPSVHVPVGSPNAIGSTTDTAQ